MRRGVSGGPPGTSFRVHQGGTASPPRGTSRGKALRGLSGRPGEDNTVPHPGPHFAPMLGGALTFGGRGRILCTGRYEMLDATAVTPCAELISGRASTREKEM